MNATVPSPEHRVRWSDPLLLIGVLLLGSIVWLLPVALVGFPFEAPHLLLARNIAMSGLPSMTDDIGRLLAPHLLPSLGMPTALDGRLAAYIWALFGGLFSWNALNQWVVLNTIMLASAAGCWWYVVLRLFGRSTAWLSLLLLMAMPVFARQSIIVDPYGPGLFFLFLSFALCLGLWPRRPWLALVLSGAVFGAAAGCKDAFLLFVPLMAGCFLWVHRRHRKKAFCQTFVALCALGLVYAVPYVNDIKTIGYPYNQNLILLWPTKAEIRNEIYLHLYPDPYTYFFDRERFTNKYIASLPELSLIERLNQGKLLLNFRLGGGIGFRFFNGVWLLSQASITYFQQELIGSLWLWLFVIPGWYALHRRKHSLAWILPFLIVASELIIRFVLHYERNHFLEVAWIFALFGAVGIAEMGEKLKGERIRAGGVMALITGVLVLQSLLTYRIQLARDYRGTPVPLLYQIASAAKQLPVTAVVAVPFPPDLTEALALMSNRTIILLREETVASLFKEGNWKTISERYGITYLYGYDHALTEHLRTVTPAITAMQAAVLPSPDALATPWLRWLVNVIK